MKRLLMLSVVACTALYSCSDLSNRNLRVRFGEVNGLRQKAGVYCRGVRVGSVAGMAVDAESVVVNLRLAKDFRVREGDKIEIATQTLLGDKVVEIRPGPITASLLGADQVIRGVDQTTSDLMVKALIEIISSAPEDRERIMDKWRSWLELNGLWPKGQQLDERRKVGEAGKEESNLHSGSGWD